MRYYFSPFKANVQPFLFRGNNRNSSPSQIQLRLPNLFLQPQTSVQQGPFSVTPRPGQSDSAFPYQAAFPATSPVWQFDAARVRASLKSDFLKLLVALESKGLRPGALAVVQQVLAQGLPLTFAETVLYRHGLDPERRSVDLQPGMRLRIEPQIRQFVGPDAREQLLNGFVGSGTALAEIGLSLDPAGNRVLGFNPFLSALRPLVEGNAGGGGGVIDLYALGLARAHGRLFYPPAFAGSDSLGFTGAEKNAALLLADTRADLEAGTDLYLGQGSFDGLRNAAAFTFRGRVAVTPEIRVFLEGQPEWVPVGTTFRQWASRFTVLPPPEVPVDRLHFYRSLGNLVDDSSKATFFRSSEVEYEQRHMGAYSNGSDCYDLPLLAGDALERVLDHD